MCSMFSSKALIFCSKTLIYQIKTILMTSFIHYEVTWAHLHSMWFQPFSTLFLKLFKELQFWGRDVHNTACSGFFFTLMNIWFRGSTNNAVNAPHKNKKYRCHKQTNKHKYLVYMCIFCVDLFHIFQCFQQNHNYVSLLSSVHKLNLIVV